jgi:hypothetical protein
MTVPSYVLGAIYTLLIGSLFQVMVGGGAGRLLFYLLLSLIGGAAGQWLGVWMNWTVLPVGPLNLGMVTIGSLVLLGIGHWLSLVEIGGNERDKREV